MDDQVWITANGRSEVGVFVEAEGEVAKSFGGVTRLLEGTEHAVGEDALFGLAGKFFDQALIVLRSEVEVGGGEGGADLALAAGAAGGAAGGFLGRRDCA